MSALSPTPDQFSATHPEHHIWVSANAGTGKTRVLVNRFLRLLLRQTPPENILCLTYTNAAASEMKERLFKALEAWAVIPESELSETLTLLEGTPPSQSTLQLARNLYLTLVDQNSRLQIQTIHSFCQKLLSQFPLEAGISPQTTLADDTAIEHLKEQCWSGFISGSPSEALATLLTVTASNNLKSLLFKQLDQPSIAPDLSEENMFQLLSNFLEIPPEATIETTIAALNQHILNSGTEWHQAITILQENPTAKDTKTYDAMRQWAHSSNAGIAERSATFTALCKALRTKPPYAASRRKKHPEICSYLDDLHLRAKAAIETIAACHCRTHTLAFLSLRKTLKKEYDNTLKQHHFLTYQSLLDKSSELLQQSDMMPWVLFRLDNKISHVLIDEAQDTSRQQWQIVRNLMAEIFTYQEDGTPPRTLFVVGDEKQSIFRFQGAHPEIFASESGYYAEKSKASSQHFAAVSLQTSFRSTPAILDVVDATLAEISDYLPKQTHTPHRTGTQGKVCLWPLTTLEKSTAQTPTITNNIEQHADLLASEIAQWLKHQRLNSATGKPVEPQDILILVQKRQPLLPSLIRALRHHRVPCSGLDRLTIAEHLITLDILALMQFICLPDDDLNLANLLKSAFFRVTEEQLFHLAWDRGAESLWQRVQQSAALLEIADRLRIYREEFHGKTAIEIITNLQNNPSIMSSFYEEFSDETDDILQILQQMAVQYLQNNPPALHGFIRMVQENKHSIKRNSNAPGHVTLSTVHGAKGLEAPIVILADAQRGSRSDSDGIYSFNNLPIFPGGEKFHSSAVKSLKDTLNNENIAEYHRLLYVALTRAKDECYITGYTKKNLSKSSWYTVMQSVMHQLTDAHNDAQKLANGGIAYPNNTTHFLTSQELGSNINEIAASQPDAFSPPVTWEKSAPSGITPTPVSVTGLMAQKQPALFEANQNDEPPQAVMDAASRGTILHHMMERCAAQYITGQPITSAALQAAPLPPHLSPAMREAITAQAVSCWQHPEFQACLTQGRLLVEQTVYGTLNQRSVKGIIDVLVETPEIIHIIDYKTGHSSTEKYSYYATQLIYYQKLLQPLYPTLPIKCHLFWLDEEKWQTITTEETHIAEQEMLQQLRTGNQM